MKRTWLGVLLVLPAVAPWWTRAAAQEASARFSSEGIEVLEAVSAGYDINGSPAQAKPHDEQLLQRLSLSADPQVGALAILSLLQAKLHAANVQARQPKTEKQLAASADEMPRDHIVQLEQATQNDDRKAMREEMLALAKDFVLQPRKEVDRAINDALGTQRGGFIINLCLKDVATQLVRPGPADAGAQANSIGVRIETARDRFGAIALTNKTEQALHHCLVVTRMIPDRSAGDSMAIMNKVLGHLAGEMGLDPLMKDTTSANRLRALIAQLEQGVLIYVPEIPAGATVRTSLCAPNWLPIAKVAELSLWCDELTALDVEADNLDEVRKPRPRAEDLGPLGFPKRDYAKLMGPAGSRETFGRGPGPGGRLGTPPRGGGFGGGLTKDGDLGGRHVTPPGITRNPRDPDAVTIKRGSAGGFSGIARGGLGNEKRDANARGADAAPKGAPAPGATPPPRAASTGPAFKALKKATFITLLPLEAGERAKGYVFPTCVPSGGSYRTNGKEITLDYAPPAMLKAVAEGPDAYVAIGQDRAKGQTYLVMVPKERVEGGQK